MATGPDFMIESDSEEGSPDYDVDMYVDMGEVQYEEELFEEEEEEEDDEGIETSNEDSVHSSSHNSPNSGGGGDQNGFAGNDHPTQASPEVEVLEPVHHGPAVNGNGVNLERMVTRGQGRQAAASSAAVQQQPAVAEPSTEGSSVHGVTTNKASKVVNAEPQQEPREMYSFAEEPIFDSEDEDIEMYQRYDPINASDIPLEPLQYDPFPGEELEDCGDYVRKISRHYCPYCNETIDDKAKWMVHTTCYFLRRQVEAINDGEEPFDGERWVFKCEIDKCPTTCVSLVNLRTHMTFHFEKTLACKRCDHKSYNIEGMQIHIRTHTRDKPYKCSMCPKEYTQKLSLDMHIEKQHAVLKNIPCLDMGCNKMFSSERMMLEHRKQKQRWREKPKKFICDIVNCGASFKTSQERSKHYAKRHPGHVQQNEMMLQELLMASQHNHLQQGLHPKSKVDKKVDLVDGRLVNMQHHQLMMQ